MLEILPSVAATVIGGYLLAQLHFGRPAEPSLPAQIAATTTEQPTVGEDRAAMREVLKVRRETPEQPAQVRRVATATPAASVAPTSAPPATSAAPPAPRRAPATTAAIPVGLDSISPRDQAARPAPAPSRPAVTAATTPSVTPSPAAPGADAQGVVQGVIPGEQGEVYVPAPPPGLPPAPARDVNAPTVIVPSVASETPAATPPVAAPTPPPAAPAEPAHQGPVGLVFSTVSGFVGHAANATGHTVNWVIDLPGKAISAGGRVIGVSPPPPPPPPPAHPSAS